MRRVETLRGVDLSVRRGSVLALVGDSGAGKSTLARCIAMLDKPEAGAIHFGGNDVTALRARELRALRPQVQLIFQDPATALNPRFTAEQLIAEPLLVQGWGTTQLRCERSAELMREVGLSPDHLDRRPAHFSGGQQQRLAMARALALRPRLLVLDEALSGLDPSTEVQIANLLLDLRATHDLTCILISHDLALVAQLADEVAVMHAGSIVECGPTRSVLSAPSHGATRAAVEAATAMQSLPSAAGGPA